MRYLILILGFLAFFAIEAQGQDGSHQHTQDPAIKTIQDWIEAHEELHESEPEPEPEPDPEPEPEPDPEPGGSLDDHIPAPGEFALIPDSNVQPHLWTLEKSIAEYGETAGRAAYDEINGFSSYDIVVCYTGWAFGDQEIRLMAGGGHSCWDGNDILTYSLDSLTWNRETVPERRGDMVLYVDETGRECTGMESGPPATHTYDGLIAVRDEILYVGTTFHCGYHVTEGGYTPGNLAFSYNRVTKEWKRQKHLDRQRYPAAAYDPPTDTVYLYGRGRVYALDPSTWKIKAQYSTEAVQTFGTMTIDAERRVLYLNSSFALQEFPIAADGSIPSTYNPVVKYADTEFGSSAWWANAGTAVADDGRVLIFNRSSKYGAAMVYAYDPADGSFGVVSSVPMESNVAGIFGKFSKVPGYKNLFITILNYDEGLLLYTLPDKNDPQPEPDPEPDPTEGRVLFEDDFEGLAYFAVDDESRRPTTCLSGREAIENPECKYRSWYWGTKGVERNDAEYPQYADLPDLPGPRIAEQNGNHFVEFTIATHSDSGGGGYLQINFIEGLTKPFGPGDKLVVEFDLMVPCTHVYTDCDPDSPTYKTEKHGWDSQGIPNATTSKYMILATGDVPGFRYPASACTWLQIVLYGMPDHALGGYHSCGWYAGFAKDSVHESGPYAGERVLDNQPSNLEGSICPYHMPGRGLPRGWGRQAGTCFFIDSDEWIRIRMELKIGQYQPKATPPPLSNIRLTGQYRGGPEVLVFDHDFYIRGVENEGEGYGKLWLLPFTTAKDIHQDHPEAYMRFDNVRVCETACP